MAFNRKQGVTLFMTLLSAFSALLSRWSGQAEVVVGTPVAGRTRHEIEDLIGFFINTLVLRVDLSDNPTFVELVRRSRRLTLDAQAHQDLPFEQLVEALQPERDLSRTPLFQVVINMLNVGQEPTQLTGLTGEYLARPELESKFDLTLYVSEPNGRVDLTLVYNADLFAEARIAALLDQLEHLLTQITRAPEQRLSAVSLITNAARPRLPDPTRPLNADWHGTVHERVSVLASSQPDRPAVVNGRVTWELLGARGAQQPTGALPARRRPGAGRDRCHLRSPQPDVGLGTAGRAQSRWIVPRAGSRLSIPEPARPRETGATSSVAVPRRSRSGPRRAGSHSDPDGRGLRARAARTRSA